MSLFTDILTFCSGEEHVSYKAYLVIEFHQLLQSFV